MRHSISCMTTFQKACNWCTSQNGSLPLIQPARPLDGTWAWFAKHGPPEHHKGCLANKTLKGHKATWLKGPRMTPDAPEATIFWLPVDGYPDFYIHFGVHCMKHYSAPSSEDE